LAGYIAPAEAWAAFSDEWQAILEMKPPLARFKMSEAHGTWGEQLWNERLPLFYGAIERHVSAGVSMLIPYPEYSKVFRDKQYAANPYYFAFTDIIAQVTARRSKRWLCFNPEDSPLPRSRHGLGGVHQRREIVHPIARLRQSRRV